MTEVALLWVLVALLAGVALGRLWERFAERGTLWPGRRGARESAHYILGLNFLVSNQLDLAISELTKAARLDAEAIEIHMVLGNLYREKGQVERAVHVHQGLLQRPGLSNIEHAYALLCLGLDFKKGGFVDRALAAFTEVLRLDPKNLYALIHLQKLHEEQHAWEEAYRIRQAIAKLQADDDPLLLAFLKNEIGVSALKKHDLRGAQAAFEEALALDAGAVPAYLNLGDLYAASGNIRQAIATWEQVLEIGPDRAYLTLPRLEQAYPKVGATDRFAALCRRLIAANEQDWRARLALAGVLEREGRPRESLDLRLTALEQNPHALSVHEAIWRTLVALDLEPALVERYITLSRQAVFYLDPHICLRCRYRSTELLWQCPHCHEWNTFVEERIAPAKDEEKTPLALSPEP